MIHIPYMLFPLLLVVFGCAKDQCIEHQDLECLALTVDDSLYYHLVTDSVPINPRAEIYVDHTGPVVELVDGCLRVRIAGGGLGRSSLVYQLVWNGEITNDTADVHFYLYDPNYVPGQEMVAIGWRKNVAFDLGKIVLASNSENLFLQTHYYDTHYNNRYRKVIQLR